MEKNIRDSVIGISVEDNTVSACVLSGGHVVKTQTALAEAGQISATIRKLTEGTGIKKCVLVLPSYSIKTLFNPVQKSAKLSNDKMFLNIPSEFRNYISASEANQYVYDYRAELTGENSSLLDVIPVAVKKSEIFKLEKQAKDAGLIPIAVITKEECYARILDIEFTGKPYKLTCFIDIKENSLAIRFYRGHLPVLSAEEDITLDTPYEEIAALIERAVDQFKGKIKIDAEIEMYITGEYADDDELEEAVMERIEGIKIKKISKALASLGGTEDTSIYAMLIGACLVLPSKGSSPLTHKMNLHIEEKKNKIKPITIMIPIIIVLLLAVFGWFGIYSPLHEKSQKEEQLKTSQTQLAEAKAKAESYADVRAEYVHYYRDYETENEAGTLDRTSCLNIIKHYVFPYVTVTDVAMKGNELTITAENASMKTISKLIDKLNTLDFVDYATPEKSSSDDETDTKDDTIAASTRFTIVLAPSEEVIERGIGTDGKINKKVATVTTEEETKAGEKDSYITGRIATDEEISTGDLTNAELAWQVIRGKWDNEQTRWNALDAAGYDSTAIQNLVDEICKDYGFGTDTSKIAEKDINEAEQEYYAGLSAKSEIESIVDSVNDDSSSTKTED